MIGNDHPAVVFVESGEVIQWANKRGQGLPAQSEAYRETCIDMPLVLAIDAGLDRVGEHVWAGLCNVGLGR